MNAGMQFGSYTVIDKDNSRYGHWNCVCKCGKKKSVSAGMLRTGKSKQCNDCRLQSIRENRNHYIHQLNNLHFKRDRGTKDE